MSQNISVTFYSQILGAYNQVNTLEGNALIVSNQVHSGVVVNALYFLYVLSDSPHNISKYITFWGSPQIIHGASQWSAFINSSECFVPVAWEKLNKCSHLAVLKVEPEESPVDTEQSNFDNFLLSVSKCTNCSESNNTFKSNTFHASSAFINVTCFDQSTTRWFTDELRHVLHERGRPEAASKEGVRKSKEMQHVPDRREITDSVCKVRLSDFTLLHHHQSSESHQDIQTGDREEKSPRPFRVKSRSTGGEHFQLWTRTGIHHWIITCWGSLLRHTATETLKVLQVHTRRWYAALWTGSQFSNPAISPNRVTI